MLNKEVNAIIRIEGGIADEGLLDIYDAANTISGLARAVNLVAHSFANDEVVRTRAQNAHGSRAYIRASTKGCFEENVDIRFTPKTIKKIGKTVIVGNFWDYLTLCWLAAVGKEHVPTTPFVHQVLKNNELFIHEIADALEVPMQLLHKSIATDQETRIFLHRPRVGDVMTLDSSTLEYVSIRDESEDRYEIVGNVTRFNVLSYFGRLYSDNDNRVISFRLSERSAQRLKSIAVSSMQEVANDEEGKRVFDVTPVVSSHGVVKRYIVHDIKAI